MQFPPPSLRLSRSFSSSLFLSIRPSVSSLSSVTRSPCQLWTVFRRRASSCHSRRLFPLCQSPDAAAEPFWANYVSQLVNIHYWPLTEWLRMCFQRLDPSKPCESFEPQFQRVRTFKHSRLAQKLAFQWVSNGSRAVGGEKLINTDSSVQITPSDVCFLLHSTLIYFLIFANLH